jgi:integrase
MIAEYSITPLSSFKNGSDDLIYTLKSLNNYKASTSVNVIHAINYLTRYLESKKQTIKVSDLNVDIVLGFRDYMFENSMGQNSVKLYIALIKMLINKAIDRNIVDYYKHPFKGVKIKALATKKVFFTVDEIEKFRKYKGKNELVRDMFMFKFFGYGMRISELLLLKWSNFHLRDDRLFLEYYQVKAKTLMKVEINPKMVNILDKYLVVKNDNYIVEISKEIDIVKKEIDSLKLGKWSVNNVVESSNYSMFPILPIPPQQVNSLGYTTQNLNIKIDNLTANLNILQSKLGYYKISKMPIKHPIFRFDSELDNYKSGNDLTLKEYKSKQRITNMINKRLKVICKAVNIQIITTHSARHSFSRLMQQRGMSVENIGSMLGHTSSKNTFIYLSELDNGIANKEAAGHFNIFK